VVRRARVGAQNQFSVIANVLVERNLIRALAPPPPSLPVADLIDDNAEDPRAQRRLPAEPMKRAEHAQENFLGQVERLFPVAQQMGRQPEDEPMMLEYQRGVSHFVARQTALDEYSIAAGDL
jgi:hypothetical protein